MEDLQELMRGLRESREKMNQTFDRVLKNTTYNIQEGDTCAVLDKHERTALDQVRDDAMNEEAQEGNSLRLLDAFVDELYHPRLMQRYKMDEETVKAIRDSIIPYLDTRPGTGYAIPRYFRT